MRVDVRHFDIEKLAEPGLSYLPQPTANCLRRGRDISIMVEDEVQRFTPGLSIKSEPGQHSLGNFVAGFGMAVEMPALLNNTEVFQYHGAAVLL